MLTYAAKFWEDSLGARTRLLAGAGPSVTAIALDCGFSHLGRSRLGRLAQAYRAARHEPPSVTLRRARPESRQTGWRTQGHANRITRADRIDQP